MLSRLADYSGTWELALLLDWFAAARIAGSPYRVSELAPLRRLAGLLDERSLAFGDKLNLLFIPADLEKEVELRLFTSILQAIERGEKMPVGQVVPSRTDGLDDQSLEDLSRACDLYYWASRRFPALFPDREAVGQRRAALSVRLGEILSSRGRRQRDPGHARPKEGFRGAPRKRFGPRRR